MRQIFTLLMTVSLLAHAAWGCCAHSCSQTANAAKCHQDKNHALAAHGDHQHSGHENTPTPHTACCHVKCHWLSGSAPNVRVLLDDADLAWADVALVPAADALVVESLAALEKPTCCPLSAQPLRLHLAVGVLLI